MNLLKPVAIYDLLPSKLGEVQFMSMLVTQVIEHVQAVLDFGIIHSDLLLISSNESRHVEKFPTRQREFMAELSNRLSLIHEPVILAGEQAL
jgi:hypothetical protein